MCKLLVAVFLTASFIFISQIVSNQNAFAADPPFTVTYDGNGNTGGTAPTDLKTYTYLQSFTVEGAGDLEKTGFTFNTWNDDPAGTGASYSPHFPYSYPKNDDNLTLYAIWAEDAPTTYSVTYDGNGNTGGSVPIDTNAYISTSTVTVLGNTGSLVRTDYTFAGWNTAANGSGTSYDPDDEFSMGTANVTLYAQWKRVLTFTNTTLPFGTVGSSFSYTFAVSGGTGSTSFAVTSGVLPQGLTLAAGGLLSGTPAKTYSGIFTVTATDSSTPPLTASKDYKLTVLSAPNSTTLLSLTLTPPTKLDYQIGESLDTGGMKVMANYSNGTSKDVTAYVFISGFDSASEGSKTVTVGYGAKTATFEVLITAFSEVKGIKVTPPSKTKYVLGEVFDTAGMQVTAEYSDGTTRDVTDQATISGFDSTTAGNKTITVLYQGKTAVFTVKVTASPLVRLDITQPTTTIYDIGDSFDPDGMKVTAVYDDGSREKKTRGRFFLS